MNATKKPNMTGTLIAAGAGMILLGGTSEARADRVRVAASLPGVAFDFGPHHGAVAIGTHASCRHEPRQVWHGPVYEWREVWVNVPAVIEHRRVAEYGSCGRRIGYRTVEVVIAPARRELRTQRVVVRDGYYETVYDGRCDHCDYGASVSVGYDNPDIVISKAPTVRQVRRAVRRAYRTAAIDPIRPHQHGVHIRVRR